MVQEVIPPKIELSQQEISQRLVQFYGTTLLGLIVQSDMKHHHIVILGDVAVSRNSWNIQSIGGTRLDEGRRATVIAVDLTHGLFYLATPTKSGDLLFQAVHFEEVGTGAPVDIYVHMGKIISLVVDGTYEGVRVSDGQVFATLPAGYQPIKTVAGPLPALLQTAYAASLNGAFAINPTTGAFLGLVNGMDPATGSAVMTWASGFEVSMRKVWAAFYRFLEANPGVSLESIATDPALYSGLRAATYVSSPYLGLGTFWDRSSGRHIIYSIYTVVIDGTLAERKAYNATETPFKSPANQDRYLLEDYTVNKSNGHGTIVSLEYTDDVSGKTVIANEGDLYFPIALDMAALRATGFLKMGVKWDTQEDLFEGSLPAKTYRLDLDRPETETVAGVALRRNLSELTYHAKPNGMPQIVALQPGTAIDSLDLFKANDFDNLCHPPGPCGGGYYPYQVVAIRPYYHPTAADFASATYGGDYLRYYPANDFNFGAYPGGSVVNFNGGGCCS